MPISCEPEQKTPPSRVEVARWKRTEDGSALRLMKDRTFWRREGSDGKWVLIRFHTYRGHCDKVAKAGGFKLLGEV